MRGCARRTYLARMALCAAPAEHAAASDRRMGPPTVRRRRHAGRAAPRGAGEHASADRLDPAECCAARPAPRHSLAEGARASFGPGGVAAAGTGGADQFGDGRRTIPIGRVGVRGSAMGRSDLARCLGRHRRTRRARAIVRSYHCRPEFRPSWGARSHHGTISLTPVDGDQMRHMVGELSARHALPQEIVEGVTERTGGVPLFVEEVTRLLLERSDHGGIQVIPPTLQQSLTARLDRLGPGAKWRRSALCSGATFPMRSSALWLRGMTRRCKPLWIGLPRPTSCWSRACRRMLIIASSMRSFRMRLMRICSRAGARFCIAASARRCATSSLAPPPPSRSCWRITLHGRVQPKRPSNGGAKRDSGRWNARRWLKPQRSSHAHSLRSRLCLASPALRREQIKLQVALITPLAYIKG